MIDEFFEQQNLTENPEEYNSEYALIQEQWNDAVASGDETLARYYKNQLSKLQSLSKNESKVTAGKGPKLGGGLSAYQVLKSSANDDFNTAATLRNQDKRSEADYYENRGKNKMQQYEAAVERQKAEAERIKAEEEARKQRDKEYREKEEAEKRKLEEQRKAEEQNS